jgi:hypothetical protein
MEFGDVEGKPDAREQQGADSGHFLVREQSACPSWATTAVAAKRTAPREKSEERMFEIMFVRSGFDARCCQVVRGWSR